MNLTKETIRELLDHKPTSPAVTIYIPTHRAATPPNMSEDQIRTKNLIHKAVEIIKNRDDGSELEKVLCNTLETMLGDRDFWEHQTEGLLICARPGMLRMYHLPIDTEEYVAVSDHFHLAPIFGLIRDPREYYVLVVSQHEPALFKGDAYDIYATDIMLPDSLVDGLNLDELHQKTEQQRSNGGSGFNGRGGAKDPAEEDRLRFWRQLDQIISTKLDTKVPLLLAGTDSELAEYRSVSHYPHILSLSKTGSFGGFKPHDLFVAASAIFRKELDEPVEESVIDEYNRAKGQAPDQAAHEIAMIQDAADNGRIDKLLLGNVRYTADTVQDNTNHVPVITFPPEESAQAVQDIAYEVWNSGGAIMNVDSEAMPEPGALMLATLRY
jgi:hypothetical protein